MVKYVNSAPQSLIDWYKTGTIRKGRNFLERLITYPAMNLAWRELSKRKPKKNHATKLDNIVYIGSKSSKPVVLYRNEKEDYATKLFKEIVSIEQQSRKPVVLLRSEEKKKFLTIAEQAQKLTEAIAEGPLDRPLFEYFSAETMHTNGIVNWDDKSRMERGNLSYGLLTEWPLLVEILRTLESQALKLGDEAMKQHRLVERQKKDYRQLYFVRALAEYVKNEYSSPLYGTVARISSVVLGVNLTKEAVAMRVKGSA